MSQIKEKYQILFTPFNVGNVEIKNRFTMAGMGGNDEVSVEGACAPSSIEYYVERARGGIGLVCTGTMTILDRPKYKSIEVLLTDKIDPENFVRTFQHMNDRIHAYGAKSMIQLSLGTAPSKIKGVFSPSIICNDLTADDFKHFVERYRIMSKVAKDAGFDLVEVHAVHTGYLLDQIVSEATNQRTDKYGGSLENRTRIMGEIRDAIRSSCGPDFPVSVKLGSKTEFYDVNPNAENPADKVKVLYRHLPETVELAKAFEKFGYNMIVLDDVGSSGPFEDIRKYENVFKEIQSAVAIPVVGSARLNDPDVSSDFIRDGSLTAICLGRQSFADPDYVNKLRSNNTDYIRFCLSCNQGCIYRNMKELTVKCAINAVAGRETDSNFAPLKRRKKVMVIGGGPAGMEAARVAGSRGHEVTLYERQERLGGDYFAATDFPFRKFGRHYIGLQERLLRDAGVKVVTGREIGSNDVETEHPDVVIVAVGADEFIPPIPGIDSHKVVLATDYILNSEKAHKNVVIIGGGMTGAEIGLEDSRSGKTVTLVEMQDDILLDSSLDYLTRGSIMKCIGETDMRIMSKTRLVEINDAGAVVEGPGGRETIPADVVVLAVGFRPRGTLYMQLQNYAGEVYNLGNSKKVGNVCDAVWAAYEVGNGI